MLSSTLICVTQTALREADLREADVLRENDLREDEPSFDGRSRPAPSRLHSHPCTAQIASCLNFPFYLSRACLGKVIIFSTNGSKEAVFSYLEARAVARVAAKALRSIHHQHLRPWEEEAIDQQALSCSFTRSLAWSCAWRGFKRAGSFGVERRKERKEKAKEGTNGTKAELLVVDMPRSTAAVP